jgi:hypothetical protein
MTDKCPPEDAGDPVNRMDTSAPSPIISSAVPSSPSVAPELNCTAGSTAPQAPQNNPNAINPASARRRSAATRMLVVPEEPPCTVI